MVYVSPLIKFCLVILVLATSPLVGVILSRMTKEELFAGKKYFKILVWFLLFLIVGVVDSWLFGLLSGTITLTIVLTSVYFLVVTSISLFSSKNR